VVPLTGPPVAMLRSHAEEQARERKVAGDLWVESDYVSRSHSAAHSA
jgi:hypothetical protein